MRWRLIRTNAKKNPKRALKLFKNFLSLNHERTGHFLCTFGAHINFISVQMGGGSETIKKILNICELLHFINHSLISFKHSWNMSLSLFLQVTIFCLLFLCYNIVDCKGRAKKIKFGYAFLLTSRNLLILTFLNFTSQNVVFHFRRTRTKSLFMEKFQLRQ